MMLRVFRAVDELNEHEMSKKVTALADFARLDGRHRCETVCNRIDRMMVPPALYV